MKILQVVVDASRKRSSEEDTGSATETEDTGIKLPASEAAEATNDSDREIDAPANLKRKGKGKAKAKATTRNLSPSISVRDAVRQQRLLRTAEADPEWDEYLQRYGSEALARWASVRMLYDDSQTELDEPRDLRDDGQQESVVESEKDGREVKRSTKRKVDQNGSTTESDSSERYVVPTLSNNAPTLKLLGDFPVLHFSSWT